jgi:hypothetical protein
MPFNCIGLRKAKPDLGLINSVSGLDLHVDHLLSRDNMRFVTKIILEITQYVDAQTVVKILSNVAAAKTTTTLKLCVKGANGAIRGILDAWDSSVKYGRRVESPKLLTSVKSLGIQHYDTSTSINLQTLVRDEIT